MSVAVNPPKTPITKGSNGIATATLPNVCKMPGPPAPFVPTPLPNIGKSGDNPKDYSTTVKVQGDPVAIKGASFESIGDIASKGTGGGMASTNTQGACKFIAPGSMDVKFDGGNVQLLGDSVTNNGAASGNPANAATMVGTIQNPEVKAAFEQNPENKDICGAGNHSERVQYPKVKKSEWLPLERLKSMIALARNAEDEFENAAAAHNIADGSITHGEQLSRRITPEEKSSGLHDADQKIWMICTKCKYRREIDQAPSRNSTVEAKSSSDALKASDQKTNNLARVQQGKDVTYKTPPLGYQKYADLIEKGFQHIPIKV